MCKEIASDSRKDGNDKPQWWNWQTPGTCSSSQEERCWKWWWIYLVCVSSNLTLSPKNPVSLTVRTGSSPVWGTIKINTVDANIDGAQTDYEGKSSLSPYRESCFYGCRLFTVSMQIRRQNSLLTVKWYICYRCWYLSDICIALWLYQYDKLGDTIGVNFICNLVADIDVFGCQVI